MFHKALRTREKFMKKSIVCHNVMQLQWREEDSYNSTTEMKADLRILIICR